ncbi:patatin-like phospholipase family protein [Paenibacillus koleovorans]|uniref:patatin-like phospholipase family protein n=1 Tax=Paenibacillus koleovorans TaxID=121608 RepID=UPI000FD72BFB|nr:patatin family protein [Paenibacillus koleovorans]
MLATGLVLEGGGMRGVYTAGVLERFAEENVYFPYLTGVSAGACMAASYLSRQRNRNRVVNIDYVSDPRYLSWTNYWRSRQLFGMDFIFDEIPNRLVPFDFETFAAAEEQFVVGTTDCRTGRPVYFEKHEQGFDGLQVMRASSSLPFIAPIVSYQGMELLDGGISDPIPVRRAESDGYARNVVILTRNLGYRKKPNAFSWLVRRAYRHYPELVRTMLRRHEVYNDTMEYIERAAANGSMFVIRPEVPLAVGRMERNRDKLEALYRQGYEDAGRLLPAMREWAGP